VLLYRSEFRAPTASTRMDIGRGVCYLPPPRAQAMLPGVSGVPDMSSRRVSEEDRAIVQIFVRDNNVDQALKALKKKMQREGSFREMKRHVHYEKPSEKRARQKAEAVRRARKLARKRAQREGLIAAPVAKR
jgi:small subunit ribosomal protein S21